MSEAIRVALAGLRFGAEFIPIYVHHPNVAHLGIVDTDPDVLAEQGDKFEAERRHASLAEALGSGEYDAVHLVTPIPLHAEQAVAVLDAGLHCACTVPMATSLDGLRAILAAQRRSGRNYMMMETAVYTREFFLAKALLTSGELGRIQLLRGAHYQDMEGWPPYWMGLPPMHYATHAVSPCLCLAGTRAAEVHCYGSGRMRGELHEPYGNPFPVETAIFKLAGTEACMEVTRSLFQTARDYTESFNVYGEKATFEWQQLEKEEDPVVFRATHDCSTAGRRVPVPDRQDLLPPEIARFTQRGVYDASNPHRSFLQGGGHGGSHPHLVHEFVRSIVEERPPAIDAVTAANWTAAGICAHTSAMNGGERVVIPDFTDDAV
jgi:predicted dehydrogenase